MTRRRKNPDAPHANPRLVDSTFGLSEVVTARLRGFAAKPDEAYLQIFVEDSMDSEGNIREGGIMRFVGLDSLKILASHLQDFVAKMESQGDH
jgi:hypothetical protein